MKIKRHTFRLAAFLIVCSLAAASLCTVCASTTVKAATSSKKYNAKTAKKNVKLSYKKTADGILVLCKNKNAYAVKLNGVIKFKDAANHVLSTEEDSIETVGARQTAAMYFKAPLDANGDTIKYAKYAKKVTVQKPSKKSYSGKIQCTTNMQTTGFNLSVFNNTNKKLDVIRVSCIVYDRNNRIVDYAKKYVTCYDPNTSVLETITYSPDCQIPDHIKCYVDTAYQY